MTFTEMARQMDANILEAIERVKDGYRDDFIRIDIAGGGVYKVVPLVSRLEELRVKVKGMYRGAPRAGLSLHQARRPITTYREFIRDGEIDNARNFSELTGVKL